MPEDKETKRESNAYENIVEYIDDNIALPDCCSSDAEYVDEDSEKAHTLYR